MGNDLRVQRPDGSLPWPWQDQPPASQTGAKLFQDFSDSIVKIENGLTSGTGWIAPDGRVVTAYHVIKSATEIFAITQDGKRHRLGGRVSIDDIGDLAALEFVDAIPNAVRLPVGTSLTTGADVRTIGHPGGWSLHLSEGKFKNASTILGNALANGMSPPDKRFTNPLDIADYQTFLNSNIMVSEIPCRKGNSGGPIFNDRNEVVSVCSMGKDGTLLGPSPERLSAFLQKNPADEKFQNSGYYTNGFSLYLTALERQPLVTLGESAFAGFAAYGFKRLTPKAGVTIRSCATTLALPYVSAQTYFDATGYLGSTNDRDSWKYGLATVADTAMVAGLVGAALFRNPRLHFASKALMGAGALARLSTEVIPNHYVLDISRTNGDTRAPFLDRLILFPMSSSVGSVSLSVNHWRTRPGIEQISPIASLDQSVKESLRLDPSVLAVTGNGASSSDKRLRSSFESTQRHPAGTGALLR